MKVLKFQRADMTAARASPAQLRHVMNVCAYAMACGAASGWEIGETEAGDPQIYLLGPPPDFDCILLISRLGNIYVLEDGQGRVLFEHRDPILLAEQATAALSRRKSAITARIAVGWCALREAVEERTDAVLEESMDLLTHLAPQIASLA